MKRIIVLIPVMLGLLFFAGCKDSYIGSVDQSEAVTSQPEQIASDAHGSAHMQRNFRTHLTGDQEVPAVETDAQGQATFQVSKDGTSISYKLIVANIENVLMAHIHLAPAGQNGGVVVWLYPSAPPPQLIEGRSDGVLAEGTITADDLVGALAGQTLDDLLNAMKAGNTYVNVHTSQNPPGEIRGQIF
ncbi:CHRD domain-containing protein [Aliifodinibius sp. S!AR15-10]|uniref:CHRD domain-containing protein n=1 Tax=Aliifodinibius sp. S!AR15-10 TaxID=2950437 RepID=UPI0028590667|nr:CHRD domain-containing protein [Aliifodinibius sp. S!AR15-10]MDR8392860.1 CHRD domain-containing protein [Aliifodinibius sp. S!AR15-10]